MAENSFVRSASASAALRLRVLVVDDDPEVRRATARLLPEYEVCVAQSVDEALELIGNGPPFDAVISDLMMPAYTGADLHGFIAACWPALARRFVLVTGGTSVEELRSFAQRIDCPMLIKPINRLQLLTALLEVNTRPKL